MKAIPIKKNKEYIVDIIDNGFEGEGIAKINDFTIFIPNAIKGEKIKVLIVKAHSPKALKILGICQIFYSIVGKERVWKVGCLGLCHI